MPEGHTIHRLARDHTKLFGGRTLQASSPQGRFEDGAARIDGHALVRVRPYGKHLFYSFAGVGERLHVHLGLYGKFRSGSQPAPEPRGALRLRLQTEETYSDLRGPTACELLAPPEVKAILARLGPDPLDGKADSDAAWRRLSRSRRPVGALLMDQEVLAGVGNVYRAEVLYRAGLDPYRPGTAVSAAEWDALWADLVALMRKGVRSGSIVTTEPGDRQRRSGTARAEDRTYVYRRAGLPCRVCGTEVQTADMVARRLYWCPTCQVR